MMMMMIIDEADFEEHYLSIDVLSILIIDDVPPAGMRLFHADEMAVKYFDVPPMRRCDDE